MYKHHSTDNHCASLSRYSTAVRYSVFGVTTSVRQDSGTVEAGTPSPSNRDSAAAALLLRKPVLVVDRRTRSTSFPFLDYPPSEYCTRWSATWKLFSCQISRKQKTQVRLSAPVYSRAIEKPPRCASKSRKEGLVRCSIALNG